jgi:hypothetical protein
MTKAEWFNKSRDQDMSELDHRVGGSAMKAMVLYRSSNSLKMSSFMMKNLKRPLTFVISGVMAAMMSSRSFWCAGRGASSGDDDAEDAAESLSESANASSSSSEFSAGTPAASAAGRGLNGGRMRLTGS